MIKDSLEALQWLTDSLTRLLSHAKGKRTRKQDALLKYIQQAAVLIDSAATAFAEGAEPWSVVGELRAMTHGLQRIIEDLDPGGRDDKFDFAIRCRDAMEDALGFIYIGDRGLNPEEAPIYEKRHKQWKSRSNVVVKRLQRVAGELRGLASAYHLRTQ
jgi:hypothetical protein